ncbi:hypothetical protein K3495_g4811 [Podosphaera aphanis]|nr:hypothetical protein K3495_g4811 [Podosphaera aphanis]
MEPTRKESEARIGAPQGTPKDACATRFLEHLAEISPRDIILYSDSSKLEDGSSFPLGKHKEVFDAEVRRALEGILHILTSPASRFAENLWICLHNLEVATRLRCSFPGSSQAIFKAFQERAAEWQGRDRLPHIPPGEVMIRWFPGHSNVPGNEGADIAAKAGEALPAPDDIDNFSLAAIRRWAKGRTTNAMTKLWSMVAPQGYQDLGITTSPLLPRELCLPRFALGKIIAARTGHGDFADYHERFRHDEVELHCTCGYRKTTVHFFCARARRRLRIPADRNPGEGIPRLLGTFDGAEALSKWFGEMRFFSDIYPRG